MHPTLPSTGFAGTTTLTVWTMTGTAIPHNLESLALLTHYHLYTVNTLIHQIFILLKVIKFDVCRAMDTLIN